MIDELAMLSLESLDDIQAELERDLEALRRVRAMLKAKQRSEPGTKYTGNRYHTRARNEIEETIARMPDEFTSRELYHQCAVSKGSVHLALRRLCASGDLVCLGRDTTNEPARYRKVKQPDPALNGTHEPANEQPK